MLGYSGRRLDTVGVCGDTFDVFGRALEGPKKACRAKAPKMLQMGSKGLQMAQNRSKCGQSGVETGQKRCKWVKLGVTWGQKGSTRLKRAQQKAKVTKMGQNCQHGLKRRKLGQNTIQVGSQGS